MAPIEFGSGSGPSYPPRHLSLALPPASIPIVGSISILDPRPAGFGEIRWGPAREKDLVGEGASKTRLCGRLPAMVQQGSGGSSTTREGVRDAAVHVVFHDNTTRELRMRLLN
jgi:hypothetical protein